MVETFMHFHIFLPVNIMTLSVCDYVFYRRAHRVATWRTKRPPVCGVKSESRPIMETSDNTNFRCPSISEARLSAAVCALGAVGAAVFHHQAGLHQGTPQHSSIESAQAEITHTLWLCVCDLKGELWIWGEVRVPGLASGQAAVVLINLWETNFHIIDLNA